MPTYEYRCKNCGHEFEEVQSINADSLVVCPQCGQPTLFRVISGAGIIFKGKGFYITDYKNNASSEASAPSPANGTKANSSEGSSSSSTLGSGTTPASAEESAPAKSASDAPPTTPSTSSGSATKE